MKKYFYSIFCLLIVGLPQAVANAVPLPRNPGLPTGSIAGKISDITKFVAGFVAVLAILMIIISGIMYMTSAGDSNKVETAKNWLTYSIIGLIVSILAYVIVIAVGRALGAWY